MRWARLIRSRWAMAVAALIALIATFPLYIAASLLGLADIGVAARSLRGPVWWGAAEELQIGAVRLGTVDVMLAPLPLLVGRARIDISRDNDLPDDIAGALSVGLTARGIDDVTGAIPLGAAFAPLPVTAVNMYDVSIHFSGARCVRAEGRIRAHVAGVMPGGVDLANGLSGEARCDGEVLLIPLVSQSGTERIDIRLTGNGGYRATMTITAADPVTAAALGAAGFQGIGGNQVLRVDGHL